MLHLLKIEWLKVKHYWTFWILLALIFISIPALNYLVYYNTNNALPKNTKQMQQMILGKPFSFPLVWQTTGWLSGLMLFIPCLLLITLVTNEFTYKTHRQNIIDGISRIQFITVKLVLVLVVALLCTLLVFGTGLWIGHDALEPGETYNQFTNVKQLGYYFVQALSYLMVSFMLSLMIKRAALVIGVFFLYTYIFENVLEFFLGKTGYPLGRYLPLETCSNLIRNPLSRLLNTPDEITAWNNRLPILLTFSAAYLILYCIISLWYFRTKDL